MLSTEGCRDGRARLRSWNVSDPAARARLCSFKRSRASWKISPCPCNSTEQPWGQGGGLVQPTERGKRHSERRRPSISFTSPFYYSPFLPFIILHWPPLCPSSSPPFWPLCRKKKKKQKAGGIGSTSAGKNLKEYVGREGDTSRGVMGKRRTRVFSPPAAPVNLLPALSGSDAQMCQAGSRVGDVSPAGFWPQ